LRRRLNNTDGHEQREPEGNDAASKYHCRFLSLPSGEQKRQNAPRVKDWATTLAIMALLLATVALAEDFKTVGGKLHKDATIIRVEADGVVA
jgi:hypothetical protein